MRNICGWEREAEARLRRMKHVHASSVLAILALAACSSSSPSSAPVTSAPGTEVDASSAGIDSSAFVNDDGGTSTGDASDSTCSNVVHPDANPDVIDGLTKAWGLWQLDRQISGGVESPFGTECDAALAYRIGAEVLVNGTPYDFASCTVKQGGLMEMSAGPYDVPAGGCVPFSCTGKMGLLWSTATTGAIYALDANGKPKGTAALYLTLRANATKTGFELILGNLPNPNNGYVMVPRAGDATSLQCH